PSCCLTAVLVSLYLITRLTPATLFPYTTLFRSSCQEHCLPEVSPGFIKEKVQKETFLSSETRVILFMELYQFIHMESFVRIDSLDRKSTRLHASHVKISYAVFCLKKKMLLVY